MKKRIVFLITFFFALGLVRFGWADSTQDKLFKELDEKLKKYETVDFKNIEGIPTYMLNLEGTDIDVIEAYLETRKDEIILYEKTDDGKWAKQTLKRIKSRHA